MWLALGVLLFGGSHLFSLIAPDARDRLKLRLGKGPYMGLYSLVALAGIVCLGLAYSQDTGEQLYEPWDNGRHIVMTLVLIGFVFIFANQSKGYIRHWLKQPFSVGIAIWATAHLLANGESTVVAIFGMLLFLAVLDIVLSTMRGKVGSFEPNAMHDLRAIGVGLVLYAVFLLGFHPYVLGVPVIS
jgi:uncharacterized membrane protein